MESLERSGVAGGEGLSLRRLVQTVEVARGKQAYLRSGFRMYFKSPSAQVRVK
jgi:hypothetical protein